MAKKNALPKTLHVFEEVDSDGSTWFTAYKKIYDCGEMGVKRLVGVYELKKILEVESVLDVKIK